MSATSTVSWRPAPPPEPGGLILALNRGSEVFAVDRHGPRLAFRRTATAEEDIALTRAARLTVERLAALGLDARIVSERLNRRKIDLIPEPEWEDPPEVRIAELLAAVEDQLTAAGIAGLPESVKLASDAAVQAGLADPKGDQRRQARRDRSDRQIPLGSVDHAVAVRRGIAPEQVVIAEDELGPLGGLPGSD